jgi:cytochrome c oxidase subunit 5a
MWLTMQRNMSSHKKETDEEFDQRWKAYFDRPNIDGNLKRILTSTLKYLRLGWDIRQGINHMNRLDLIPEPEIISACLQACRRVNDHSLAIRYLEAIRHKANAVSKQVWPWIVQEIRPTLDKLGVSTPEDLAYDKPELALKSVDDM